MLTINERLIEAAIPMAKRPLPRRSMIYTVDYSSIAASGTLPGTIPIESGSDFLAIAATRVVYDTDSPATETTFPPLVITVFSNTSSGRALINTGTHLEALFGTAQQPGVFPWPLYVPGGSQLVITLQNLDSAQAYYARLTLIGFAIGNPA